MENNEFNNNEENKIEETVVQEPNKSKKKTAIILVIGLVTFTLVMSIGIGIFWIKSFDGTSKTGHTKSPFSTSNKDTSNTNTSDDDSNIDTESDDNTPINNDADACGVSIDNYVEDEEVKNIARFLQSSCTLDKKTDINIFNDPVNRLAYLELVLMSSGKASATKDDMAQYGQSLQTITYNDYLNEFINIFGNNYDFEKTISDLGNNYSIFNRCESKPSVNDGNHVCWMGTGCSGCKYFFVISNRKTNNGSYIVSGNYYNGSDEGTFEFNYTIDGTNKYLKSVVLTKTN